MAYLRTMRIFLCFFLSVALSGDTLRLLFWNLENCFDPRPDSTSVSELDFSAFGSRRWSRKRYDRKIFQIAKTVLWAARELTGGDPHLPDVAGFAELEKKRILTDLVRGTALRKMDYVPVHFESPDPRGIDVGLIYRKSVLTLLRASPVHILDSAGAILPTRDILLAEFLTRGGDTLAILVCHFPSKYGGASVSMPKRQAAVRRLETLADSLSRRGFRHLIAMGDFNDTPDRIAPKGLVNAARTLWKKGRGTIRYEGTWELIDMFFVSPPLASGADMRIPEPPFLLTRDRRYGGRKPLRTYSGPRYLGGVSDHLPILLFLSLPSAPP